MLRSVNTLLAATAFALACWWSLVPVGFELVRPRLGIPEVALGGEVVRLELRDGLPFESGDAPRVTLVGAERIELVARELSRRGAARSFELQLPEDLRSRAYALEVELRGVTHSHPKAVHVLDEYPEEYKIVHLADVPTFLGDGRGDVLMARIVEEVNMIAPDLVLISGDIAYAGTWAHFHAALEHFEDFDAPLVAGIGNHEYKGLASFFTLFGPLHHVVDLGDRRVITLNSGHGRDQLTESQARWMRAAFASREQRKTLVQLHHPTFWKRNLEVHVDELVELCREHEVPVVLAGHWHGDYLFDEAGEARDDAWDFDGTKYVVTTAAGADLREEYSASPLHHGYRLLRLTGNELIDYTYDWDGDGVRHSSCSIPVGKLSVSNWGPQAFTVHNELNESFDDALVPMWLDGEVLGLEPDVGTLVDVAMIDGRTRYRVRIDLKAQADTLIQLEG